MYFSVMCTTRKELLYYIQLIYIIRAFQNKQQLFIIKENSRRSNELLEHSRITFSSTKEKKYKRNNELLEHSRIKSNHISYEKLLEKIMKSFQKHILGYTYKNQYHKEKISKEE